MYEDIEPVNGSTGFSTINHPAIGVPHGYGNPRKIVGGGGGQDPRASSDIRGVGARRQPSARDRWLQPGGEVMWGPHGANPWGKP